MTTQLFHRPTEVRAVGAARRDLRPLGWLAGAAVLFFTVPLVGTDWLGLQPDLYYLIYFTVAVGFFTWFVAAHVEALRDLWTAHLWQSLLVGALAGAALAIGIFRQVATPHADGWRFGFEIVWRGVVYGSVDALTLYVMPAAVAYLLLRGDRRGFARKASFAGLALVLSMFVTATYHLGYTEYRGETIRSPEIGAVVANLPAVLTGNPLGAVVTHGMMHVASVIHLRDGGSQHMLPPRVDAGYPNHGSSDLAAGLAAVWLLATAGALDLLVQRRGRAPRSSRSSGDRVA